MRQAAARDVRRDLGVSVRMRSKAALRLNKVALQTRITPIAGRPDEYSAKLVWKR